MTQSTLVYRTQSNRDSKQDAQQVEKDKASEFPAADEILPAVSALDSREQTEEDEEAKLLAEALASRA